MSLVNTHENMSKRRDLQGQQGTCSRKEKRKEKREKKETASKLRMQLEYESCQMEFLDSSRQVPYLMALDRKKLNILFWTLWSIEVWSLR